MLEGREGREEVTGTHGGQLLMNIEYDTLSYWSDIEAFCMFI